MNTARVRTLARECGFTLSGVVAPNPTPDADSYLEWVASGMAGRMAYLTDGRALVRQDPKQLLPSAKSIVCVALSYHSGEQRSDDPHLGWIARYARGEDYHEVVRSKLIQLAEAMQREHGFFEYRVCVDTAPLLERSYARLAGLGWIGKNTCLINQEQGSYVYLGELLVSLELEFDEPAPFRCGTCTRCIDACPTAALIPGGFGTQLDARRCISYLTIELKGSIAEEMRAGTGHHIFGCDICQEVCPWNGKALPDSPQQPEQELNLDKLASMSPEEFRAHFRRSAVWRTKYTGFLRNVAVAMGNSGLRQFEPALEQMAKEGDEVVAEHARWALKQLAT